MLDSRHSIYQIVTDRFYDGDHDNYANSDLFSKDKLNLRKYLGGDWEGIIRKIKDGYIPGLGVRAILISQPVENVHTCMEDEEGTASYHGYWPRDFMKPNPYFGSLDKFLELIQVAHQNHLKVLIDFTPNHTSPALELKPNYMENGALYHKGQLVAKYSEDIERIFLHNGGTDFQNYENSLYRNLYDLASLDHMNPTIDQILREGIQFWLDLGVDGIRIDAAKHIPPGWLKSLSGFIYSRKQAFIFGEWFLLEHEGSHVNSEFANENGMSLLHFMYSHSLRQVLLDNVSFSQFINMIDESFEYYKWPNDQVIFLDNHDMSRFTKGNTDTRFTDIALSLLLTSVGIPLIYYGTEQYMTGENDPDNRRMMNSFSQTTAAYRIISKLNRLRRENIATCYGAMKVLHISERVLVFERTYVSDVVLVIVNLNETCEELIDLNTSLPSGRYLSSLTEIFPTDGITVDREGKLSSSALQPLTVSIYSSVSETTSCTTITHFSPRVAMPGSTLVIHGMHLGEEEGYVDISNNAVEVISWNSESIVVRIPEIPAVTPGYHSIKVTTRDGFVSNILSDLSMLTAVPVTVRIVVTNAITEYGSDVYLSGNLFELGEWDSNQAIGPFFNSIVYRYPTWYYDVSVPAGYEVEFNFLKKYASGIVKWEGGGVHTFTAPMEGISEILVDWQD
ncbi:glycosidase [Paenibacillus sp. DS2015]|uniref:alpha-amylase family glycosyl hydrolase n=1 Tax=Paenibacillus sp. DS2015 TaxID=3373917 RepID=UPI003D208D9F